MESHINASLSVEMFLCQTRCCVQRCAAEPGPIVAKMAPGSAAHRRSASKTRVTALMALRSIRGTVAPSRGSPRADFEQLAVVAGLERDTKLPAAVQPGHDGHHRDDRLAPDVVERRLHIRLLAEPDQVTRGRKRQFEPPALPSCQRLARRQPDRIGGFLAVMRADLFGWGCGEKEPGIEALGHAFRRDP